MDRSLYVNKSYCPFLLAVLVSAWSTLINMYYTYTRVVMLVAVKQESRFFFYCLLTVKFIMNINKHDLDNTFVYFKRMHVHILSIFCLL